MSVIEKFINVVYEKVKIKQSPLIQIFTRYGVFQAKMYKDDNQEYLALMSQGFYDLKEPIVYIYNEAHWCDPLQLDKCYCNNMMNMALIMIRKVGGAIIYHSHDGENIDGLLKELKVKKLQHTQEPSRKTKHKNINIENKVYRTLGFVLKDLNLETIKLIANDNKVPEVIEQLGIEIIKKEAVLSYEYTE